MMKTQPNWANKFPQMPQTVTGLWVAGELEHLIPFAPGGGLSGGGVGGWVGGMYRATFTGKDCGVKSAYALGKFFICTTGG